MAVDPGRWPLAVWCTKAPTGLCKTSGFVRATGHLEDFYSLFIRSRTDYFPIYLGPALQIFPHLKCLFAAKSSSLYLFFNDFEFGEKETFCLHIPEGMDSCIVEVTHGVTSDGERTDLSPVNFGG